MNTGIKDPTSVILNIDRKFDKLTAYTADRTKVGFYVHYPDQARSKDRNGQKLAAVKAASFSPGASALSSHALPSEEQTKSLQKYERELQFKNRVLAEKEKAIFNAGVMQKFNKHQISSKDLKSDSTLTNQRLPSKNQLHAQGS